MSSVFARVKSSLLLAGMALSLSACVSSVSPISSLESAANTTQSDDMRQTALNASDDPNAVGQNEDGSAAIGIPIPKRNPLVVATQTAAANTDADVTQTASQTTKQTSDQTSELALVKSQAPEQPKSTTIAKASSPSNANARQATNKLATDATRRPGLLARLFQRPKANVGSGRNTVTKRPSRASLNAMPGVKSNEEIFGIKRNPFGKPVAKGRVRMASVLGMSRFSPKSLKTQTSNVDVDCIKPELVKFIKIVERRYGRPAVVTSGYRSPSRNRRAGGAKNSMHIYCKAVDIQVKGVSKWDLAKYMRSIPGRGGVGTYCRTKSVHLDLGPKRDWHHSCRRKSKRRRKA